MTNSGNTPDPTQPNNPTPLSTPSFDLNTDRGLSDAFVSFCSNLTPERRSALKDFMGQLFGTSRDVAENWMRPRGQNGHRDFVSTNRAVKPMPDVSGWNAPKNTPQYRQAQSRSVDVKREFVRALFAPSPARDENGNLVDRNARCYTFGEGGDNTDYRQVDYAQRPGSNYKSIEKFRQYIQSGVGNDAGIMKGMPSLELFGYGPRQGGIYFRLCYYRDSDPNVIPDSPLPLFQLPSF